jgi:hypothetical protein
MDRQALGVVAGLAAPSLRRPGARPRLRPGEYPVWYELGLSERERALLRRRAHQRGVGVDAFVGVSLEYLLVAETVGGDRLAALMVAAAQELGLPTISSSPELRAWQLLLEGRGDPSSDELPSVCVAMRLLSQLPVRSRLQKLEAAAAIGDAEADAALLFETIATRHGLTMGFWALRQLVVGVS